MKRLLFCLCLTLLAYGAGFAASGDYRVPTTVQGGTNWTNWVVDTINASDDKRASYNNTAQDWAGATGFGFTIPTGAIIDSLIVEIEGNSPEGVLSRRQYNLQLLKAGTGVGDIMTGTLPQTTDGAITFRGNTNTRWGTTWEASETNASGFGLQIRDANGTAHLLSFDHVRIAIWYSGFRIQRIQSSKPTGAAPVAQNITGVGFRPKAVIGMMNINTAQGINASSNMSIAFGDMNANEVAVWFSALDAQSTGYSDHEIRRTFLYVCATGGGGVTALSVIDSLTTDGIALNWTTNNGTAYIQEFLFFGGYDIDSTWCDTAKVKTTTGTQDYTNCNFSPDVGFIIEPVGPTALATQSSPFGCRTGLGVFTSASSEGCSIFRDEYPPANSNSSCWQGSTYSLAMFHHQGDTLAVAAEVSSILSNGVRFNFTNVTGSAHLFGMLLMEGDAQWQMGFSNAKTTTGTQAYTTSFRPDGLLIVAHGDTAMASPATNTYLPHSRFWMGFGTRSATSGYVNGGMGSLLEDNQATSDYDRAWYATMVYAGFNQISPTGPSVDAALSSFNATDFTLDFGGVFGVDSARQFMWAVGGAAAGAAPPATGGRRRKLLQMGWRDEGAAEDHAGTCQAVTLLRRPNCYEQDFLECER